MQDRHERVEHLRAHILVHVLIGLVIHMFGRATSHADVEDVVRKLADFLLIVDSVSIVHVLTFYILVKTFALLWPLHLPTGPSLGRRWRQIVNSSTFNNALHVLNLYIPVERHVREHDADVLRRDVSIIIEIIHVESKSHLFVQITDEDVREVLNKRRLCDEFTLFPLL